MDKKKIRWGIIGCGDVAEIKSGPAFNKIKDSKLLAVMRRNADKAASFAKRHQVPYSYSDADLLLENEEINAVYIATPPSSHLELAIKSLKAGKMIYLEKPMVLNIHEAQLLNKAVHDHRAKLCVAHYRRALPAFQKVKELLDEKAIGTVRLVEINIRQPLHSDLIANTDENWRIVPEISGGGYFYDLAPHQLDLMCFYFGDIEEICGLATNQSRSYEANDMVTGLIKFKSGVHFSGTWAFNIYEKNKEDNCIIYGSEGRVHFSFYGDQVTLDNAKGSQTFNFINPRHIQEPMIQKVVDYFLDDKECNPCSVQEALVVQEIMEKFTRSYGAN
ncbi:Gfo/Idh/MocA family protein [Portibacter marinus]|uniref:Gfo/Idh/MocA family protein n=1 Tax=Portibacter marinus TaxID=2898660 RepID=UPI001F41023C|nr:Gfo/Idh/MocA family oxidoreductase [Portibacter marinus]